MKGRPRQGHTNTAAPPLARGLAIDSRWCAKAEQELTKADKAGQEAHAEKGEVVKPLTGTLGLQDWTV